MDAPVDNPKLDLPPEMILTSLISKNTKSFLPFWAFPIANKLTSVPFFPNLKILKPYGDHNLEHDLQISSRHLSGKTASPGHGLGCWTLHKHGNLRPPEAPPYVCPEKYPKSALKSPII